MLVFISAAVQNIGNNLFSLLLLSQ